MGNSAAKDLHLVHAGTSKQTGGHLTPRQIEILKLVAEGYTNEMIAECLSIVLGTVKNHVKEICRRLGARSRTHSVTLGIRRNIIR